MIDAEARNTDEQFVPKFAQAQSSKKMHKAHITFGRR